MRPSFVRSFALLAAAGCSSAALGQQFSIATNDIYNGSSVLGNSYIGPSSGADILGYVNDGGYDAFDSFMFYDNISFGGLTLNRRVETLSAINTYRTIDTFTNYNAWPLAVYPTLTGNLGSDIWTTFVRNDVYASVTYENAFGNGSPANDPVVGFMNGNNNFTANYIFRSHYADDINTTFTVVILPGESISFMFAAFLARDINDRSGDIALAQNTVNAMLADPYGSGLYTGLTQGEIDSIINWTVPTPGAAALLGLGGLASSRRRRA